jgi:hypothetical protein
MNANGMANYCNRAAKKVYSRSEMENRMQEKVSVHSF